MGALEPMVSSLPGVFFGAVCLLIVAFLVRPGARKPAIRALTVIAALMFAIQPFLGLLWTPPEQFMGDVYRIIYMHVPELQVGMLALTINFGCSIAYLFRKSWVTDALAEATAEIGLLFGSLGVLLGTLWAKPTWGTWWTWDPRLVSAAILLVIYTGYLAMRRFVEEPERRATWSAVMGIFAFVDIPVLWFSVNWWRSMHQVQSNKSNVEPSMYMTLQWSKVAFLALFVVLTWYRYHQGYRALEREVAMPSSLPEVAS
jgi:heme exporter protein C